MEEYAEPMNKKELDQFRRYVCYSFQKAVREIRNQKTLEIQKRVLKDSHRQTRPKPASLLNKGFANK